MADRQTCNPSTLSLTFIIMLKLTVAICTYNPRLPLFNQVLLSLRNQTLPYTEWELIIVDNNSSNSFVDEIDISWHPNGRIVVEAIQGLTPARIRSVREAQGKIMVCVDDDNILIADYLERAMSIMNMHSAIGAVGGKSLPIYETPPPEWFKQLNISLGCRDLGGEILISNFKKVMPENYPLFAPIGTGLVIRRTAYHQYIDAIANDSNRKALGRAGKALTSGEDNDIMLTLISNGWELGYFPCLVVDHVIPATRLTKNYLARMAYASNKSWVQVLAIHGISPWNKIPYWTLFLRQLKAFFKQRAWRGNAAYIRWRAACGILAGQATLS